MDNGDDGDDGGLPPYVKGSDTSKAAAISMSPYAQAMRMRYYNMIVVASEREAGAPDYGLTVDEIETIARGIHQTVSARCTELEQDGLIADSGRRRNTRHGRKAVVLVVTPKAPPPHLQLGLFDNLPSVVPSVAKIELSMSAPLEIFPFVTSMHREVILRHHDGEAQDIEMTPDEADRVADLLKEAAARARDASRPSGAE